ncbi:hypothetical protein ABEF93_003438 [Exophiala dermatitidis]
MFNENFSFATSPHSPTPSDSVDDGTSADISPTTSRCPSPKSRSPAACRDTRFDAYRQASSSRHPSITALTEQLQSQALHDIEMPSPSLSPSEAASPAASTPDTEADEGFYDGPDTPATAFSDFFEPTELDPTLWDLSMSDTMIPTSSPRPSLSLEAQAMSSYTMRRRQRQALIRLQCMVSRAPDLAMLIEECHPSSLPLGPDTEPVHRGGSAAAEDEKEDKMKNSGQSWQK